MPLDGLWIKKLFLDSRALPSKPLLTCCLAPDLQQVSEPSSSCLAYLSHMQQGLPHTRTFNCLPLSNQSLAMYQCLCKYKNKNYY